MKKLSFIAAIVAGSASLATAQSIMLPLSQDDQINLRIVCATAIRSPAIQSPDQTLDIADFCVQLRARMAEHAKKPVTEPMPLPQPKPQEP